MVCVCIIIVVLLLLLTYFGPCGIIFMTVCLPLQIFPSFLMGNSVVSHILTFVYCNNTMYSSKENIVHKSIDHFLQNLFNLLEIRNVMVRIFDKFRIVSTFTFALQTEGDVYNIEYEGLLSCSVDAILKHIKPCHILTQYFFTSYFNIGFLSTPTFSSFEIMGLCRSRIDT